MPSEAWLHPDIEVRESEIHGRGLFAIGSLDAGLVVVRLGGRLVGTEELRGLIARATMDAYVDTVTIEEDQHLVLPAGTPVHYGNHCCDPTMWHVGPFEVATRRAVGADEELTIDYATNSGDATFTMDCTCGAMLCRGTITAQDWRRPELQERYAGHWIPALAELIGRRD